MRAMERKSPPEKLRARESVFLFSKKESLEMILPHITTSQKNPTMQMIFRIRSSSMLWNLKELFIGTPIYL